jgi:hypothetical protein
LSRKRSVFFLDISDAKKATDSDFKKKFVEEIRLDVLQTDKMEPTINATI